MAPMLEVADIFRRHGEAFRKAHAGHLGCVERRIMGAITACRTAALGGHVEQCDDCGATRIAYNSCLMGRSSNGELACRCWHFSCELQRSLSP
jgi:Transposase zinc-binding domain